MLKILFIGVIIVALIAIGIAVFFYDTVKSLIGGD